MRHSDKNELYDLINDPLEQHNLILTKPFRESVMQIEKELARQIAESVGLDSKYRINLNKWVFDLDPGNRPG